MIIYYGANNNLIDVTNICIEKLTINNIITIPSGDHNRAIYFNDPLWGIPKKIIIKNDDIINEYDEYIQIKINILNKKIETTSNPINEDSTMKIYYGANNHLIDVTHICIAKLTNNNIIQIPSGDDNRMSYFTDPLWGIRKKIFINIDNMVTEYDPYIKIKINRLNNTIDSAVDPTYDEDINNRLIHIHSNLKINYGDLNEELPEQKMVIRYLTGNEKVLEIGGNIGRNSLIIASILGNNNNLVTLESNINTADLLRENRDLNNFNFHIEYSALSNRKLIQKGWDTIPSNVLLPDYSWVNTITFDNLKAKYNIEFDTLVLDCEGAFYYILMDMPEILNNINLIIMENDYYDISQKNYIDNILINNNFNRVYIERGGWGPCYNNFFEVWKK